MRVCVFERDPQQAAGAGTRCEVSVACAAAAAEVFHYNWLTPTAGKMEIKRDTDVNLDDTAEKKTNLRSVVAASPTLQFPRCAGTSLHIQPALEMIKDDFILFFLLRQTYSSIL